MRRPPRRACPAQSVHCQGSNGPQRSLHAFQVHLVATGISWPALNQIVCALRFFYGVTLGQDTVPERIAYAREPSKLPVVLSADEVCASWRQSRAFEPQSSGALSDPLMSAARQGQWTASPSSAAGDARFRFCVRPSLRMPHRREHPPTGYPMSTTACISFFWTTARARVPKLWRWWRRPPPSINDPLSKRHALLQPHTNQHVIGE